MAFLVGCQFALLGCARHVDRAGLARQVAVRQDAPLMSITPGPYHVWRYAGSADGLDHLVHGRFTGLDIDYRTYALASGLVELPRRLPYTDDVRRWIVLKPVAITAERVAFLFVESGATPEPPPSAPFDPAQPRVP